MFQLFHSIFGREEKHGRYPESLIEAAIERTVDSTDPRIRVLPGYRKLLRAPVLHAIDHVSSLIDNIPPALPADRNHYNDSTHLSMMFASVRHMQEVFIQDDALNQLRDSPPENFGQQVVALLLVKLDEKKIMGMDIVGDMLRRDIAQVAVNFSIPRLVDPAAVEEETRRQLKRRAFDYLLSLALSRISEVQHERTHLDHQRDLLRRKLRTLKYGGWDFDGLNQNNPAPTELQAELDRIEKELAAIGANDNLLRTHLDLTSEVLANAEQHFWAEDVLLHLDRMNIQRDPSDKSAREIKLQELHDARGRRLVMLLVSIPLDELPRREDFVTAAKRYLG